MAKYHAFSFTVMVNILEGTDNPGLVAENIKDAIHEKLDDMNQQDHFTIEVGGEILEAEEMYEPEDDDEEE